MNHWWVLGFLLLCVGGLVAVALWTVGRASASMAPGRALQILQERFARGEIDEQELERRKAALRR